MPWLQNAIDFLTDSSGLGFPILMAAGLLIILWLMHQATKPPRPPVIKPPKPGDRYKNTPYKPF